MVDDELVVRRHRLQRRRATIVERGVLIVIEILRRAERLMKVDPRRCGTPVARHPHGQGLGGIAAAVAQRQPALAGQIEAVLGGLDEPRGKPGR